MHIFSPGIEGLMSSDDLPTSSGGNGNESDRQMDSQVKFFN
jgi:hypothetical protein